MSRKLRIIFMGTPEFAIPSLSALLEKGFNIAAVITAPDRPSGRGLKLTHSPVKDFALSKGLPVMQPTNLKEDKFISELRSYKANLQVVVAFRMLPEIVWQMPEMGTFNLHASLLPDYRGAAPINHAIINGEPLTGVTTFFLKKSIDTGNIIFREETPIGPDETFGELHDRLKEIGAGLVVKTASAIHDGSVKEIPQEKFIDENKPLHKAPKIFREDRRIEWDKDALSIYNKIRGLSPYPAAFTTLRSPDGKDFNLKIFRAELLQKNPVQPPACIITDNKKSLSITLKKGMIDITELQIEGKRRMKTSDFLAGFDLNSNWKVV
jgi:methionyl-tRNA formyltransferase